MCLGDARLAVFIRTARHRISYGPSWTEMLPRRETRVGFTVASITETCVILPDQVDEAILQGYLNNTGQDWNRTFLFKDFGDFVQLPWYVSGSNPSQSMTIFEFLVPADVMQRLRAMRIEDLL